MGRYDLARPGGSGRRLALPYVHAHAARALVLEVRRERVALGCAGFGLDGGVVELAPFLFGPAQLLNRRGKVEEVNRHDRGPWTEVGVPYEGVELPPGLDEARTDLAEPPIVFRAW